jgi:hypothetical protein
LPVDVLKLIDRIYLAIFLAVDNHNWFLCPPVLACLPAQLDTIRGDESEVVYAVVELGGESEEREVLIG